MKKKEDFEREMNENEGKLSEVKKNGKGMM